MNLTRRSLLASASGAAVLGGLAACGSDTSSSSGSGGSGGGGGSKKITVWFMQDSVPDSTQANLMASDRVWSEMATAYLAGEGPLALRLLDALDAGEAAGGDVRGRQSAAIVVVPPEGEPWERVVELRVEDHPEPLIELRRQHPTFRRKRFFTGNEVRTGPEGAERLNDIVWLHLEGRAMEEGDWNSGAQAVGMYLNGQGIAGRDERGAVIEDDHFLLYFNADGPAQVTLPAEEYAAAWDVVIDTGGDADADPTYESGSVFELGTHSLVVLREHSEPETSPDHSVAASLAARTGTETA